MKSAKLTYITCCISGITLFLLGIFIIINIKATPPQSNNISNPSKNTNSFDIVDNYTPSGDPVNILLMIKEASGDNTDSIIVANYNPPTNQVSLLTIPRDTKAANTGTLKVNSLSGLKKFKDDKHKAMEYATQTISTLTNINIDYYAYLEIDTIKYIIDELGGVYFDVPADLKYSDPTQDLYINLKKGYQLLDGDKAEQLLRFRKPRNLPNASADLRKYYDGSDLKRTEMQVRFVNEFIKQKVNLVNLTKFIPIINYTFDNVVTNITISDTLNLLIGFTKASRPEMNTYKLHGVDKIINGDDYVVFVKKFEDTKTRNIYNSQDIIDEYFLSESDLFIPNKKQKYDFKSILNTNPSNADTDAFSDGQDNP